MVLLKLHNTSSLDNKRGNIYCHVLAREYSEKSSHRRIHHILGNLIISGRRTFQKSWSQRSKKHIACDGRFAFFDNYQNCIDCGSPFPGPRLKFSVQRSQPGKIEDALIMEGYPETLSLANKGYRSSLFALVKGNVLLRLDMQDGRILDEVFVAPPSVRYKRIQWNVAEESFALCSTLTQTRPAHLLRQTGQEVMHLTIMSCMPLEFVCQFAITRKVFGRDAVEASVFLNILMVMHSTNYVRMYSLERILDKSKMDGYTLYQEFKDGSRHGVHPCHLKHNITLKEPPPCLFEVRCRNRDVMITMPPCYYVMWPIGKANGYCCYSFQTRQIVEGGLLEAEECEFEERVSLHADDSGRIVHMKNSQLRLLKLAAGSGGNEHRLVEDFVIDFSPVPKSPVVRVSQSGRVIKQRVIEDCNTLVDRVVLTMTYCDDLEMIIVVSTRDQNSKCDLYHLLMAGFYDNWSGQLLHQFVLDKSVSETLENSVCISLDTLTHICKTNKGGFECHVYKLLPLMDILDEWGISNQKGLKGLRTESAREMSCRQRHHR
ncbi:unnamed protein product [Candidula unifasciata]|uniref:Uncharacterized protein n=1 Tax=Candidula unifasciata TaxID=100452 RepID=A0A8S3YHF0_9EUPU|nr:unnamed protein product [Candidula unifasciata]